MEEGKDFDRGDARGRAAFDRDWTKGSIIRNLLSLSWPMVIGNSLNMLGPTIDIVWVGKLGAASIAGVGVAGMFVQMVNSGRMGLAMGTRAMVARFMGAGDAERANHIARQAFFISGAYAITMAVIGIFLAESILILMGVEADVVAEGAAYLRIMLVGSVAMSFRMMSESIMQASGDAVTPMKVNVAFRLFHVALCPFLVFGWWIFPRMGVSGAATTNVVSQSLGTALGLWFLFTGRSRLRLSLKNFRIDLGVIRRIVKVGIPASLTMAQRTFGNLVLVRLTVPFGTLAVAAHTLAQRVEMFLMMPARSFGMGGGVLMGQNLGAGQPKRAERSAWLAVGFVEGVMVVCSVAILLWAESVIRIFSTEPDLVNIASAFIRIATVGYVLMGFTNALMMCLSVAGDTLPPMLFTLLMIWVVQTPLAFFLPRVANLGVYGVRWAIVAGMVTGAVAYVVYFRMGRWKRKKV